MKDPKFREEYLKKSRAYNKKYRETHKKPRDGCVITLTEKAFECPRCHTVFRRGSLVGNVTRKKRVQCPSCKYFADGKDYIITLILKPEYEDIAKESEII